MKIKSILSLFLLCLMLSLRGEQVLLARFNLAGMPFILHSDPGSELLLMPDILEGEPVFWQVYLGDVRLGYIPARMNGYLEALLRDGYQPRLHLSAFHTPATPGRYAEVELWCTLRDREHPPVWAEPEEEITSTDEY